MAYNSNFYSMGNIYYSGLCPVLSACCRSYICRQSRLINDFSDSTGLYTNYYYGTTHTTNRFKNRLAFVNGIACIGTSVWHLLDVEVKAKLPAISFR